MRKLWHNWAGNHTYLAKRRLTPANTSELADLVTGARSVRVLGSRHSFNSLGDSDDLLIDLDALPRSIEIDPDTASVTVTGSVRYGELARALQSSGWALHNMASLPHISVAGAVATATHGSGRALGNLATAVRGLRILTGTGDLVELRRGDDGFEGAVVSLGALGVVLELTLDIEPTFNVRQRVFTGLPWHAITESLDDVMSAAYSVSLFTTWDEPHVSSAWVKQRVDRGHTHTGDFFGAAEAGEPQHMIPGMDIRNTTEQLGIPGPWNERLGHFRDGFTPSNGAEIQSEYLVGWDRAGETVAAVRRLGPILRPVLQVSELRSVASDQLWLSTAHGSDVLALHFTWTLDPGGVAAVLPALEAALLPLGARPHWGKVFHDADGLVGSLYPRLPDFRALAERLDPEQRFANDFTRRLLG